MGGETHGATYLQLHSFGGDFSGSCQGTEGCVMNGAVGCGWLVQIGWAGNKGGEARKIKCSRQGFPLPG